jgi:anti-sigma factor RsiW
MDDREDLTFRAAERLLKSRMRQFAYAASPDETAQLVLAGYEGAVEEEAKFDWKRAVALWKDDPAAMEPVVYRALASAHRDTLALLAEKSFQDLIDQFVAGFKVADLLTETPSP